MSNDHFKSALTRAGLTVEEFADIITVDPKTVQRWVAGRTPYPRHRAAISRALDIPEHELWPDSVQAPTEAADHVFASSSPNGDVVGAWGSTTQPGVPDPVALLTGTIGTVDVLDPDGVLLSMPGVAGALTSLAGQGGTVRVITSSLVLGQTESETRLEVRSPSIPAPGFIVLRADRELLVTLPLHDGDSPAVIQVRDGGDGLYARLVQGVETAWNTATPQETEDQILDAVIAKHTPGKASEPERRWPGRPT